MYIDISKYNLPKFRQKQVNEAILKNLVSSFNDISNIPNDLKETLNKDFIFPSINAVKESKTFDVVKKLFQTKDEKLFEAVLLFHEKNRQTVCVSSQVGCPVGCKFCATGMLGFERNLDYQEIVDQVLYFARFLKQKDLKITNIVFMGMGEPFLNIENVEKSVEILTSSEGFNISPRRITVSTIWIGENVLDFVRKNPQINIAVSLHSASQKKRESIIPLGNKVTLDDIQRDMKKYFDFSNRRLTIEYLLLEDVNDSIYDAEKLVDFIMQVNKKLILVNLLPYNEVNNNYKPSKKKRILDFKKFLEKEGINVTIRKSMGQEISSACGMLKRI